MNLRKEIKTAENQFGEIRTPKIMGVKVIDATKTAQDYQQELNESRQRFGEATFNSMVDTANRNARTIEQRQEVARHAEQEIAEAKHTAENTPLNRFIHAIKLKNVSYEPLNDWTAKHTIQEKKTTLAEFENLASRRGLALTPEQIDFAIPYLNSVINTTQIESQTTPQEPNILTRIKTAFGH